MISLKEYYDAKEMVEDFRGDLASIAKQLWVMRNPGVRRNLWFKELREFRYDENYMNVIPLDNINWGHYTKIFCVVFEDRGDDIHYVTFPVEWIGQDWKALEKDRLEKENAIKDAEKVLTDERREKEEFAEYERLKAKFGN